MKWIQLVWTMHQAQATEGLWSGFPKLIIGLLLARHQNLISCFRLKAECTSAHLNNRSGKLEKQTFPSAEETTRLSLGCWSEFISEAESLIVFPLEILPFL